MRNAPISTLLLFHFVAGILSGVFSANGHAVSSAIFLGIIFCQTGLLGMWSGLGATHWVLRLIGFTVGSIYLAVECGLGIGEPDFRVFFFVVLQSVLVATVTWVVRLFKGAVRRVDSGRTDGHEALQFTIRHLMLLTFVVACLTAIGRLPAPGVRSLNLTAAIAALALCFAAVALTSIWAMLGSGRPLVRSIFVVLIAVLAGIVGGYIMDGGRDMLFWASTTGIHAVLLVGSLCLIRAAGYRFVAKSWSEKV